MSTQITLDDLEQYFPRRRLAARLMPLPEYRCIYVKNAKAGTSSTVLWLHRIHTGDHEFTVRNIHVKHELPRPEDLGWNAVTAMLSGEAFRFTFVRDPIPRVESAYVDKIVRLPNDRFRNKIRRVLELPKDHDQELTFDQFVAALETQKPIRMDPHWRPQHLNVMHPLIEYDLVGRLETFSADLARVREAVGFPDVPVPMRNRTKREGSLFDGRPDLLRKVRDIYATDLELYGY
jgi:hypothetical protein